MTSYTCCNEAPCTASEVKTQLSDEIESDLFDGTTTDTAICMGTLQDH